MPSATPKYGWPYPTGTDRVRDGDDAMGQLATAIENTLVPMDMTPFGAMYAINTGPGVGGSMWFSGTPIAMKGGCATVAGTFPVYGIKVPRPGFYLLHAVANMQCGSAAAGMSARLFIGDGAGEWCTGQVSFNSINTDHAVSAMTVQQLGAGTNVFYGMQSFGPQSAGLMGPWNKNTLVVRMLAPL